MILNDMYQSDLCLLHLLHLLTIATLYVALILYAPTREQVKQKIPGYFGREPRIPRRSLRQPSASSLGSKKPEDSNGFFVGLDISMPSLSLPECQVPSIDFSGCRMADGWVNVDNTAQGRIYHRLLPIHCWRDRGNASRAYIRY